ncbi:hypothetical protein PTTG_08527 [Puccinia triticina 1-1 BBBD Race 1]|uniref:Uncharacterized protein n=1 Tax=Puccinia triticina (isolate 1-1 / race 1 (BBBD)) TaxID=630390 RepID=A0A180G1X9_PUCT1|nr:hypothetical protein PTTG_08527 [Puccinia triticina 1-1 BBBD Race 1]
MRFTRYPGLPTGYPAWLVHVSLQVGEAIHRHAHVVSVRRRFSIGSRVKQDEGLREGDRRPLCLHTLPKPGTPVEDIEKTITRSKSNPDKNGVGRLISIVEILKRDFPGNDRSIRPSKRQKVEPSELAQASSNQLHQYNEYGSLESLILERSNSSDLSESDKRASLMARQDKIVQEFLNEERKRPRQSHTPWLKIYLWKNKIQSLTNLPNVCYQQPSVPSAATEDTTALSGISAVDSTLVNPQEEQLELNGEFDIPPV